MVISANEVKTKGVSIFDSMFQTFSEIIINVRGKNRYVVLPFDDYENYRIYKLDLAYKEVMSDLENQNYTSNSSEHFHEIEKALENG